MCRQWSRRSSQAAPWNGSRWRRPITTNCRLRTWNKVSIAVPPDPGALKPLKGETWQPVTNHHDYKKIEGGKRADQFVNLSGNARTGETFKIAHHDGKTWHVYSNGHEVAVGGHKQQKPATTGNPSQPG